ncbi:MAG TPA: DNA translocase FtsK 4TM domain-containing protein, partial [Pirellulales bacterium]|nr:DNA translocase FtsK 4TM domain-containing protein [Pirellulales bacterium]
MLETRKLKVDLAALALSAWIIFLGLALASYDPADPPGNLVYPPHAAPGNICGRAGAMLAHGLLAGTGLGTYYLLASLVVVDALLVAHREVKDRLLRVLGWSLSLMGLTTLCALAIPGVSPGPVIGSGGYLGAVGRALLEMNFASAGSYLVAGSLTLVGLLLATDYALVRIVGRVGMAAISRLPARRPVVKSAARTTDLPASADTLAIKIGGKTITSSTKAEEAADEAEDEVAETSDDAEQANEESEEQETAAAEAEAAETSAAAAAEEAGGGLRVKARNKKDERREVMQELDAAVAHSDEKADYQLPPIDLLLEG